MNRIRHASGFSLVELLVALALGLIISAAALQMFVTSQQAASFQRGITDVQSSGRFSLDFIRDDVWRAGAGTATYRPKAFPMFADEVPSTGPLNIDAAVSGINQNDQLVLRYFARGTVVDCEGNTIATGTSGLYITSRYYVRNDADTGLPGLACDAYSDNNTTISNNGSSTGQILVAGVDNFQVLYGVDDGANGTARVVRYMTAANYQGLAAPRPTILAIRIGLLLSSSDVAGAGVLATTQDYQVLDNTVAAANVPADNRVRRIFVGTASVRNFDSDGV